MHGLEHGDCRVPGDLCHVTLKKIEQDRRIRAFVRSLGEPLQDRPDSPVQTVAARQLLTNRFASLHFLQGVDLINGGSDERFAPALFDVSEVDYDAGCQLRLLRHGPKAAVHDLGQQSTGHELSITAANPDRFDQAAPVDGRIVLMKHAPSQVVQSPCDV